MKLCKCGCGQEVSKEGNRYIRGHNRGMFEKKHSKETREKISLANKGKVLTEEHKRKISESLKGRQFSKETRRKISEALEGNTHWLGKKHSDETRRKISENQKGNQNSNFIHGKSSIYNQHLKYKKEECLFGCESKNFELHHEPEIENIFNWEGRLINLCRSCHKRVHDETLKLPEEAGIEWTKKDTERILKGD